MKQLTFCAILITVILTFISCDKDDIQPDNRPVLNYFDGYVNDEHVLYEQKTYWENKIGMSSFITQGGKILSYEWIMTFSMENGDTLSINTILSPLDFTPYKLTPVQDYGDFYSEIRGYLYNSKGKKCYRLSQQSPFNIRISIIDKSGISPGITGTMEGTLFNKDNPKDSLEIKDVRFRVNKR